jgi:hypothetical protein
MVADVQDWLDNPAGNFGWLVLGDEKPTLTAKRFERESACADHRIRTVAQSYAPTKGASDPTPETNTLDLRKARSEHSNNG